MSELVDITRVELSIELLVKLLIDGELVNGEFFDVTTVELLIGGELVDVTSELLVELLGDGELVELVVDGEAVDVTIIELLVDGEAVDTMDVDTAEVELLIDSEIVDVEAVDLVEVEVPVDTGVLSVELIVEITETGPLVNCDALEILVVVEAACVDGILEIKVVSRLLDDVWELTLVVMKVDAAGPVLLFCEVIRDTGVDTELDELFDEDIDDEEVVLLPSVTLVVPFVQATKQF